MCFSRDKVEKKCQIMNTNDSSEFVKWSDVCVCVCEAVPGYSPPLS